MNKTSESQDVRDSQSSAEMLDEYDFSQGVRGKYYQVNRSNERQRLVKIKAKDGDREVSMRTIETKATITQDGKLTVQVPSDITSGEYRIVLMIEEETTRLTTAQTSTEIDKANQSSPE